MLFRLFNYKLNNSRIRTASTRIENQYDKLEVRKLLAGITFEAETGTVVIEGSGEPDSVFVNQVDSETISVSLSGFDTEMFDLDQVTLVRFRGLGGNDRFQNNTDIDATAFGHDGDDFFFGGGGHNRFQGGDGNDFLFGGGRNDAIRGRAGDDVIEGGLRHDRLFGGEGNDVINGEHGRDVIRGDGGDDMLNGGSHDDRIFGGEGNDQIVGGNDNDRLEGEDGDDVVNGNAGDDLINGGKGEDTLRGGNGNDDLKGEAGSDVLIGGAGDDVLFGGIGKTDELDSGSGSDRLLATRGDTTTGAESSDAVIFFVNGSLINQGIWINGEIANVDAAFAEIVDRSGGSNTLIRDSAFNNTIHFTKGSDLEPGNSVSNGIRTIQLRSWNFTDLAEQRDTLFSVIHQTAHTWDIPEEINGVLPGGGTHISEFRSVSEWIEAGDNSIPEGFVASTDGEWYYREGTEFLNETGMINPSEDWATIWELAFDTDASAADLDRLSDKLKEVNEFFDSVSK